MGVAQPVAKKVAFGLTLGIFAAGWIAPRWPLVSARNAFVPAVMSIMCTGLVHEWMEWGVAPTLSPEDAESYNGQRGDPRDAHADMLMAAVGALLSWPSTRIRAASRSAA